MVLASVETRLLLVVKGAKEYFFMSTLLALVKAKLWPAQANVFKQEVVDRVIYFAQTLLSRHANCAHLGDRGQGCFGTDQVNAGRLPLAVVHSADTPFSSRSLVWHLVLVWRFLLPQI